MENYDDYVNNEKQLTEQIDRIYKLCNIFSLPDIEFIKEEADDGVADFITKFQSELRLIFINIHKKRIAIINKIPVANRSDDHKYNIYISRIMISDCYYKKSHMMSKIEYFAFCDKRKKKNK